MPLVGLDVKFRQETYQKGMLLQCIITDDTFKTY